MRTRYRFQILSLLVLAWLLLLGTSGSVIADTTQPVTVTPSNTQTFFSTKGTAHIDRSADGTWGDVTLTNTDSQSQAGAATLNTRLDFSKNFWMRYDVNFGDWNSNDKKSDGMSFVLYPGQPGAVGLFGGNVGISGLPYAEGIKFDAYTNRNPGTGHADIWDMTTDRWAGLTQPAYLPGADPLNKTQAYVQRNPTTTYPTYPQDTGNGPLIQSIYNYLGKNYNDWIGGFDSWALKNAKLAGFVFSDPDADPGTVAGATPPYGAFIETNLSGFTHIYSTYTNSHSLPTLGSGRIDGARALSAAQFYDNQWHSIQVHYYVNASGVGTLIVALLPKSWSQYTYATDAAGLAAAEAASGTNQWTQQFTIKNLPAGKYYSLNISASTGAAPWNQKVRNFNGSYTPQPNTATVRYVDENGTDLQDPDTSYTDPNLVNPALTKPNLPKQLTKAGQTYSFDYGSYLAYDGTESKGATLLTPNVNGGAAGTLTDTGGTTMTYTGQYGQSYKVTTLYYKMTNPLPSLTGRYTLNGTAIPAGQAVHFGDLLNYQVTLTNPAGGASRWVGTKLAVTLPDGLTLAGNAPTAQVTFNTQLSTVPSPLTVTTDTTVSGSTATVTIPSKTAASNDIVRNNGIDLLTDAANSSAITITLPVLVTKQTAGTLTADVQATDRYVHQTNETPAVPTSYYSSIQKSLDTLTVASAVIPARSAMIPIPVRTNESFIPVPSAAYTQRAVYGPGAATWLGTGDVSLPASGNQINLTAAGIQKLRAADYIPVITVYTNTTGQQWTEVYYVYEPLSTWMPDAGLRQTVASAFNKGSVTINTHFFDTPQTYLNTAGVTGVITTDDATTQLTKSLMPKLTGLTNQLNTAGTGVLGAGAWNMTNGVTGLEYASNLQGLAIYGPGLLQNTGTHTTTGQTFRTLLNQLQTPILGQSAPIQSLQTVDLSGYTATAFTGSGTAAMPSLPKLQTLNLVANGLADADVTTAITGTTAHDLVPFFQQNKAALRQLTLASYAAPTKPKMDQATLQNNIQAVTTAGTAINQQDMVMPGTTTWSLARADTPDQIQVNVPDVRRTLTTVPLGTATASAVSDYQNVAVAVYDRDPTNTTDTSTPLTNVLTLKADQSGYVLNYTNYLKASQLRNNQLYLKRTYTTGGTQYSLWTKIGLSGIDYLQVDTLNFGKRQLRAGQYPNNGHDDSTGPDPGTYTPFTITVGRTSASTQSTVGISASPFTGTAGTLPVSSLALHYVSQNSAAPNTWTIPADGSAGQSAVWTFVNTAALLDTKTFNVDLNVPAISGISAQKYTATITYTLSNVLR